VGLYKRTSAPILDAQKSFSNDSQGMYIAGADGSSYGYSNDHDPSNILACMDSALARYKQRPPSKVQITDAEASARFAIAPPKDATIVRVFSRIMPVPKGCSILNTGIGRDYLWIYPSEVQAIAASRSRKLPASVALRMARYNLMDNVRGTPDMWKLSEVKQLASSARVLQPAPDSIDMEFTVRFKMSTASGRRGYSGTLNGSISVHHGQIARFRALADGQAWGDGTYTPNAPKGKYHLVIAMVDAHDLSATIVPPEAVSTENNDRSYRDPTLPSVN
jgi:hypothetical protein